MTTASSQCFDRRLEKQVPVRRQVYLCGERVIYFGCSNTPPPPPIYLFARESHRNIRSGREPGEGIEEGPGEEREGLPPSPGDRERGPSSPSAPSGSSSSTSSASSRRPHNRSAAYTNAARMVWLIVSISERDVSKAIACKSRNFQVYLQKDKFD